MITQFFINPNKPKPAPIKVTHIGYNALQENGFGQAHNEYHAKKKNCTVEEFIRRDMEYKKQQARAWYGLNEKVYPYTWAEYQKKGACRILKIDRSYAYTDQEWVEGQPLYLVEALSEKDQFNIFRATPGFFVRLPPTEPQDGDADKDAA